MYIYHSKVWAQIFSSVKILNVFDAPMLTKAVFV